MMQGIMAYARRPGSWRFSFSPDSLQVNLNSLADWDGDGVLAMLEVPEQRRAAQRLHCPLVNMSAALRDTGLPTVTSDNPRIGQLAADHLLERGFRRFAYYGVQGVWYSQERCRGFRERVEAAGCSCEIFDDPGNFPSHRPWVWDSAELADWLRQVRCPVGLCVVHDLRAWLALETCLSIGWQVPQDVAIVGVNDDPIACLLSAPQLTSVAQDSERIGYEAAALLDRLMSGHHPPKRPLLIPPSGLIARASTDIVTADDATLRRAIVEIRSQLGQNIGIKQLVHHLGISRRWLEQLFRTHLQCSPHEFIARARVAKACELLAVKPPLRLHEIARQCGFRDARRLTLVFQHLTGQSPRAYRTENHGRAQ
jgi:LacI family transcriptional regulator